MDGFLLSPLSLRWGHGDGRLLSVCVGRLVTTTFSESVEVGVGELPGGDVVEVGVEVGVLLGNHEDVDNVDQRKTGEGPSETHDTLLQSVACTRKIT